MKRIVAATLAMSVLSSPLLAAGDGGGGASNQTAEQCKKGFVWDKKKEKCVKAESALPQDLIYEGGYDLAMAGRYEEAIRILALAPEKADPRVLNYLGYSHRKAGRIDVGLGYYREALRIDPDYTLARAYMGEAYLMRGDVASARTQLGEIARRAGTASVEYRLLADEIARVAEPA